MNTMGEEVLRYNFTNAMVSKISLSEGGATASGVQIAFKRRRARPSRRRQRITLRIHATQRGREHQARAARRQAGGKVGERHGVHGEMTNDR